MEHYYTPPQLVTPNELSIVEEEAKHLSKVLRKKTEDEIFVTDGAGNLYKCVIISVDKDFIKCRIVEKITSTAEPEIKIHLFMSLLKNPSRFEFAIEKSVELGVNEITPVISEFVISKTKENSKRWQTIALAAMKQSQRVILPKVNPPVKFEEAIRLCNSDLKLIAHNNSEIQTSRSEIKRTSIALLIGPEGGFSEKEVEQAVSSGFKILNLGKRKFRSETAAIAGLCRFLI